MRLRAERISEWSKGNPQAPVRIELHSTDRCNLKCKFCWQTTVDIVDTSYELKDQKLYELVKEGAAIGVREWIISGGGEPLVRKEATLNVLNLIKKYDMWGQLTTNGVLFNNSDIKRIVDIGWDQIQFSIDGPDGKIHDYLRSVNGTFKKVIGNARKFNAYKKKNHTHNPYLGFNTVLNRLNYNKLSEMIQLCYDVGFKLVYFEPIYAGYLSKERLSLNDKEQEEMQTHVKECIKLAEHLGIKTNIIQFLRKELIDKSHFKDTVINEAKHDTNPYLAAPCFQPWYLMGIKGSGIAGCCSTFETGEWIHTKTIKEMWFGEKFNNIRREMLSKNLPHYCSKCSVVVIMENKEIRKHLKEILKHKKKHFILDNINRLFSFLR